MGDKEIKMERNDWMKGNGKCRLGTVPGFQASMGWKKKKEKKLQIGIYIVLKKL